MFDRKAVVSIFLLVALTGCASSTRSVAIDSALVALNASRNGFVEWDKDHQTSIAEHATSASEATSKLIAYRAKRETVMISFEMAYTAIALAATTVGEERDRNLINAAGYAARIYQLVRVLMDVTKGD